MKFHRIDEEHLISLLCKPEGVNTCPAPDINNDGWRCREMARKNCFGCAVSPVPLGRRKAAATPGFSNNALGFPEEGPSSPPHCVAQSFSACVSYVIIMTRAIVTMHIFTNLG
jgi:hypothetical protein